MPKLDLNPNDLLLVKKILRQIVPDATVWAYGSRVKGGSHASSDLDLVVRDLPQRDPLNPQVMLLRQAFQESKLPILVDVMNWAALPQSYREEIEKKHVLIQ